MGEIDLESYGFDAGPQPKLAMSDAEAAAWERGRKRCSIYAEIESERISQDEQWGGPDHDDKHSVKDWVAFIVRYLGQALGRNSDWGRKLSISRIGIIKVAALCVAALEAFDRQIAKSGPEG